MQWAKHIGVVLLVLLLPAASMSDHRPVDPPKWVAIDWPYPRDGWPAGQAFRCSAASCGTDAVLTVRVKLGMCNCESGVRDDVEVDGLSDVDMISATFDPSGQGVPFQSGPLKGRMREYQTVVDGAKKRLVGLVLSRGCDVIAASLVTPEQSARNWESDFARLTQKIP